MRVKTAQATDIALDGITEGTEYSITVTGRQSGKTVSFDFQAPAQSSSDNTKDNGSTKSDSPIVSGKVQNDEPKALGKTGTAVIAIALVAAFMVAAAMLIKTAKNSKIMR